MRKIILLMLATLPLVAGAQTYSRWNYSTVLPNNTVADNKMVNDIKESLSIPSVKPDTFRLYVRYTYSSTDSSFGIFDINNDIVRVFNPSPFPNGITELERSNDVALIYKERTKDIKAPKDKDKKDSVKVMYIVGKDGLLPKGQEIKANNQIIKQASEQAKIVRALVEVSMRDGKDWSLKSNGKKLTGKEKRTAAFRIATKKEKESLYTKKNK